MDEETIQKKLGRHFGIDYRYVVIPNILMYGNGGMYEADFIYINKKNFLTEVEIKVSFNDFKADFNKKYFTIASMYVAFIMHCLGKCGSPIVNILPKRLKRLAQELLS